MHPHVTLVTLGVQDLKRATAFYRDGLGWPVKNDVDAQGVAFFQLGGLVLSLFPAHELAADAGVPDAGEGFRKVSLAHNLGSRAAVDAAMEEARRAGARIVKPAKDSSWGGYGGYFADPDGHLWEVAHNPFWALDAEGRATLPK